MVSSYLVCDVCGGFGPPAGFLSQNGLRLCYQCWYRELGGEEAQPEPDTAPPAAPDSISPAPTTQSRDSS